MRKRFVIHEHDGALHNEAESGLIDGMPEGIFDGSGIRRLNSSSLASILIYLII